MANPGAGASVDPALASIQAAQSQARIESSQEMISQKAAGDAATMTIASLDDFRKKYPELYKAMMDSMAQEMCRRSQRANDRVVQRMREQRYR